MVVTDEAIYEYQDDRYRLAIYHDFDPESPREWDNLGTMVYSHREYVLGDESAHNTEDYNDWHDWLKGEVLSVHGKNTIYLPLYIYDHSGVTMNTTGFNCGWDSGQIGWIYATPSKIREEYGVKRISKKLRDRITDYLRSEVKTYDQYIMSDVYGYVLEGKITCKACMHTEYESIDSCWGYYGMEHMLDGLSEGLQDEHLYLIEKLKEEASVL